MPVGRWSVRMTWLVSDANIFIDMEAGGILDRMFRLPETFAVPNVLFAEELEIHHAHLRESGLVVLDVREEFVREAYRLGGIYKKTSRNDLLALALAKQEQCPLLTGDAKLREAAIQENIEVHGTLWIMERLFLTRVLNTREAAHAYEKMRQDKRRLPWDQVERQLEWMATKEIHDT